MRRIGDPNDGTAVWTLLTDAAEVKVALEKRAKERSAETKQSDTFVADLPKSLGTPQQPPAPAHCESEQAKGHRCNGG